MTESKDSFSANKGSDRGVGESAIEKLRSGFRGELLRPEDAGYDAARQIFNAMIDKRPALIARCTRADDVVSAVNFARSNDLTVSVLGGGHSVAGKAVCDDGIVIDLSQMKGISVDEGRRTAVAEPGLRLGEFDRSTHAFGLATTLGIASDTGIAGLTLGGGLGWLNGKYGLACDNLLSAEVVTAGGDLLRAGADENPDLFWGLRGGGGNFGIVTSFEFQLHPVESVLGGMVLYPFEIARELLPFYLEYASACPDELSSALALLSGPDGSPLVAIVVCYSGDIGEGEGAVEPIRSFATPVADSIQPMPYVALQSILDDGFPRGRRHYWKSSFARDLSADGIQIMTDFMSRKPSPFTICYLQQLHGAAARVPETETAFPHRLDQFDFAILSQWDDRSADDANIEWTRSFSDEMQPHLEDTVYVNNLGEGEEGRVKVAYGPNYDRLAELKRKYDPTNFFSMNQNIKPAE